MVLSSRKHDPLMVSDPTRWSAARENTPWKPKPFSRTTDDPRSNCLARASGFQRNGEKPLFLHAATPLLLFEEAGKQKPSLQTCQQLWNSASAWMQALVYMSPFGTSLLYSGRPSSLIGTLNTLISACLLGLLKHDARPHSSLEVTVPYGEVSGSQL